MWCREHTMTEYPYILFNKSPEQLRHLGACGGRAYGRNQSARRALVAAPPEAVSPPAVSRQTAAEAIHLLDTQFSEAARCGKVTLLEPECGMNATTSNAWRREMTALQLPWERGRVK